MGSIYMGNVYENNIRIATMTFENGMIYEGNSKYGTQLGYYENGTVYKGASRFSGVAIGTYREGMAYKASALFETGTAVCTCKGTSIYTGNGGFGESYLGEFIGDVDGACAAAVLWDYLHSSGNNRPTTVSSNKSTSAMPNLNGGVLPELGLMIVIGFILLVVAPYVFYGTESGRNLFFGSTAGLACIGICLFCCFLGSKHVLKDTSFNDAKFKKVFNEAAGYYPLGAFAIGVIAIIDAIMTGRFGIGAILISIFGSIIVTAGLSVPICILQTLILTIIKKKN